VDQEGGAPQRLMRISIVVPVHGKAALTTRCLDRLRPIVETRDDVEVIVVDDGSPDTTQDLVRTEHPWARLVAHERPQGFAAACNDGAAVAKGERLLFFNNDLAGEPGWFEALLSYADSEERAAVIGCKLLYPNQSIQHAGIVICGDLLPRHVYRLFPRDHRAVGHSRRFQAVTGACLLVRRSLFRELDGFDPLFTNGFEDVDFCLRAGAGGAEVHYCADSTLVHFEAATRGESAPMFRRNTEVFLDRWGEVLQQDDIRIYVEDGLIRLVPTDVYPLELHISPELASIEIEGAVGELFRLLGIRSRQVFDLLKENTLLRVRLGETEIDRSVEHCHAADP
jgi:GT2 family glycosyltransferase